MPRGRKPKPENNYFNPSVEEAVCKYINSTSQREREESFRLIYPAFYKIAEVMLNKMKISYYDTSKEDFMSDAVAFMVEKLPKFDCDAGKKAFSYFTVVCKHYLILNNNKNFRYMKRFDSVDEWTDNEYDIVDSSIIRNEENEEVARLLKGFTTYLELNIDKLFINKKQKEVVVVLIDLLNDWEDIEKLTERNVHALMFGKVNVGHRQNYKRLFNIIVSQYTLFKNRWLSGDESLDIIKKNRLSQDDMKYIRLNYKVSTRRNGISGLARQLGVRYELVQRYIEENHLT